MTRKETQKMQARVICTIACAILLFIGANAQESQRFPAPLGLNKVLTGTISKAKITSNSPKDAAHYLLTTPGSAVYQLHGHEKELKKFVGKAVRIFGKAVGEKFSVDLVELLEK